MLYLTSVRPSLLLSSLLKCDGLWLGLPLQLLNFEFGPGPVPRPDTIPFLIFEECAVSLSILYPPELILHLLQRHGLYRSPFLFRTSFHLSDLNHHQRQLPACCLMVTGFAYTRTHRLLSYVTHISQHVHHDSKPV